MAVHLTIDQLPYGKPVRAWLKGRYGEEQAASIWKKTEEHYAAYLKDLPDYGGKKNGHARAIYGGLLVFALYPALPDQPPYGSCRSSYSRCLWDRLRSLARCSI
ncbi:MAG: hypothetical protein IJJ85_08865 [Clostridia bacterium]|nr:hypothetical protein [Clostridia bacterium]